MKFIIKIFFSKNTDLYTLVSVLYAKCDFVYIFISVCIIPIDQNESFFCLYRILGMKNTFLAASVSILAMSSAFAADGTITINGLVTDKTCDIVTPQGKDFTVTLPTVSKQTLAKTGDIAGRTPFTINLANCSEGKVATYFEPGSTVDFGTGRLNNTDATGAKNVQVQLLGSNNQFIPVLAAGASGTQTNSQWVDVADKGAADLNYYAEYYATDASAAGKVTTSVQYTIIYQ